MLRRTLGTAARGTATRSKAFVIGVVCPPGHDALKHMPKQVKPAVQLIVGNDSKTFLNSPQLKDIEALMWIPPGDTSVLNSIWPHVKGNVKWVHSFFAGVDALAPFIDEHLGKSDVPLTNGRTAFSSSLAEYAMAAILYFNKQIPRIQRNSKARVWDKFVMDTVKGKTLGLMGFGHIARAVGAAARALGMRVIAVRRNPNGPYRDQADAIYAVEKRLDVYAQADFVVSVLPGTKATQNFTGAKELAAMKQDAVFVNIGRGVTVDEDALCDALDRKAIKGAALDVFWNEPLPSTSDLWGRDNVLITAHNADFTPDYLDCGWSVWEKNWLALEQKEPMFTPVDKLQGY